MKCRSRVSFTLIEMLIVIVIIGILAAALIPRLQSVQGRARDSQRKIDLRTIHNAAEVVHADKGRYPGAHLAGIMGGMIGGAEFDSYSGGTSRLPEMTGILTSIPLDPLNTCNGSGNVTCRSRYGNTHPYCACHPLMGGYTYGYDYVYENPSTFVLISLLENARDPDRCEVTLSVISTVGSKCDTLSGGAVGYPTAVDTNTWKRFYTSFGRQ